MLPYDVGAELDYIFVVKGEVNALSHYQRSSVIFLPLALCAGIIEGSALVPEFSIPGGVYSNDVSLPISSTSPTATIHFTLDGSEPAKIYGVSRGITVHR